MNSRFVHTELAGERGKRASSPVFVSIPDYQDILLGKNGIRLLRTSRGVVSSFTNSVIRIVGMATKPEMIWIDTKPIITGVTHDHAIGNISHEHDIRGSVGSHDVSFEAEGPGTWMIASGRAKSPIPASIILNIKLFMKPLVKRFAAVISTHTEILCQVMQVVKSNTPAIQGDM